GVGYDEINFTEVTSAGLIASRYQAIGVGILGYLVLCRDVERPGALTVFPGHILCDERKAGRHGLKERHRLFVARVAGTRTDGQPVRNMIVDLTECRITVALERCFVIQTG